MPSTWIVPVQTTRHRSRAVSSLPRSAIRFHRWFLQFYDEHDHPIWSSHNTPELPPLSREQKRDKSFTVNDFRLSFDRLQPPLKEAASVCVGCSQLYVSRDMETIDRLVIFAGMIVLLISPLVGHLLIVRVIRPVGQLIRTAP